MQIIVGSTALAQYNMSRRDPKDLDIWQDFNSDSIGTDIIVMPTEIIDLVECVEIDNTLYATPNSIYTIKCSHLGWSNPAWQKHKLDILWLKSKGCCLIYPLYHSLVEHWKTILGDKEFLNLDKTKEQFFTDKVVYKYDHDYLHQLVAYPNKPMYEKCLKEGEEVLIDKTKFASLSLEDRVRMFREEISVIALERWVLNDYWKKEVDWYRAYLLALQKTITNLTKNWATEFIVLNIENFVIPDFSYFKHAIETLTKERGFIMNEQLENLAEALGTEVNDQFVMRLADSDLEIDVEYPKELNIPDGLSFRDKMSYYAAQRKWLDDVLKEHGHEHVKQEGGGEGGAEYCWGVFKLGDKHYKAEWAYYSHYGYEEAGCANTLQEVKPVEKTVTVWE